MKQQTQFLFLSALLIPLLAQAAPVLTLSPSSGALTGAAGQTAGWGFTISNPDSNYLLVTSANFCTTTVVDGFTVCDLLPSASLGVFTDFIAQFNFIVAGPAPELVSVDQDFSEPLQRGIGSFAFAPAATLNDSFAGSILLTYDLYSRSPNDPSFDPGGDLISSSNTLTANASVTVIPEPATWLLLGAGIAVLRARRPR